MLYDAKLSQDFAAKLLDEGIYVIGFYYPVVPKGQARIRVQLSAAHEKEHLDKALKAFAKIGKELGVIKCIVHSALECLECLEYLYLETRGSEDKKMNRILFQLYRVSCSKANKDCHP